MLFAFEVTSEDDDLVTNGFAKCTGQVQITVNKISEMIWATDMMIKLLCICGLENVGNTSRCQPKYRTSWATRSGGLLTEPKSSVCCGRDAFQNWQRFILVGCGDSSFEAAAVEQTKTLNFKQNFEEQNVLKIFVCFYDVFQFQWKAKSVRVQNYKIFQTATRIWTFHWMLRNQRRIYNHKFRL